MFSTVCHQNFQCLAFRSRRVRLVEKRPLRVERRAPRAESGVVGTGAIRTSVSSKLNKIWSCH